MGFPDDYIPMAEDTGPLVGAPTRHLLDTTLAQVRLWVDAGQALRVSVDLPAHNPLDE